MKLLLCLLSLSATLLLCSCGESFQEVVSRHQSDYDDFTTDLAAIAEAIPKNDSGERPLSASLDPAPVFDDDNLAGSNILITPIELLSDPDADLGAWSSPAKDGKKRINFHMNEVKNLMIWADGEDKSFDTFEPDLVAAMALRYVAVYQTVAFKKPSMIDDKTYDKGVVVVSVHLYDRETGEVVCSFPVISTAAEEVSFRYNPEYDSSGLAEGLKAAESSMWSRSRDKMISELSDKAGVVFPE